MAVSEQPHACGFALGSGPSQGPLPRSRDAEWKGVRALDLGVGNPVSQSGSECEHWPDSDASILMLFSVSTRQAEQHAAQSRAPR